MIPSQKWAVQLRACCGRPVIKRLVRKSGKASFLLVAHSFYISTSFSFSNLFASLSFSLSLHLAREIKRKKNSEKSFSSVSSWRVLGAPSSASFTLWLLLFCYLLAASQLCVCPSPFLSLSLSFSNSPPFLDATENRRILFCLQVAPTGHVRLLKLRSYLVK